MYVMYVMYVMLSGVNDILFSCTLRLFTSEAIVHHRRGRDIYIWYMRVYSAYIYVCMCVTHLW